MKKKTPKYRIKTCYSPDNHKHPFCDKVQVRKWWGWMTIKEFPYDVFDGTVNIMKENDTHYMCVCAEELLELLEEDMS